MIDSDVWTHEYAKWGPALSSSITCGSRFLGWHFQVGNEVLLICGEDITVAETELYKSKLEELNFDVSVFFGGIKEFQQFFSDTKGKMDPVVAASMDYLLPKS